MRAKKRKIKIWPFLILLIIMFGVALWIIFEKKSTDTNTSSEAQTNCEVQKNEDVISIPGYEGITLKAGSLKQDVNFKNPEQIPATLL